MSRFATLATLNVDDALPDAWVDEVKVFHDYYTQAGADIASAASIAITAAMHNVTGTTTITTITDAAGLQKGQELYLRFVSGLQLGTSGNIQTLSGAASIYGASDVVHLLYDGVSKWIEIASGDPLDLNQTAAQVMAGPLSVGGITNSSFASQGVLLTTGGGVQSISAALTTNIIALGVLNDSQYSFLVRTDGQHQWGPGGSTVRDTFATRQAAGQIALQNKLIEGNPAGANVTVPTTFTPDLKNGATLRVNVTAGGAAALTIAAPLSPPTSTQTALMVIRIANTGGGTITLSWNAAFIAGPTTALPASIVTGSKSVTLWAWDGANWQLMAIA